MLCSIPEISASVRYKVQFNNAAKTGNGMILVDIVNREAIPRAWGEGDYLPWENEHFSRTVLEWRLNGSVTEFSRPLEAIEKRVEYIHSEILKGKPRRILEIGCGPGLYTNALARLGHECVGYDPSIADIGYAGEVSGKDGLNASHHQQDLYSVQYGDGFGCVMFNSGSFSMFNPMDSYEILGKAWRALDEGGIMIIEPLTYEALENAGSEKPSWESVKDGCFSPQPYICLCENIWNSANETLSKRWYVVDTGSADVRLIVQCYQAYPAKQLKKLFAKRHFINVKEHCPECDSADNTASQFLFMSAEKTSKFL